MNIQCILDIRPLSVCRTLSLRIKTKTKNKKHLNLHTAPGAYTPAKETRHVPFLTWQIRI